MIYDANFQICYRLHPQNHRIHGSRGCLGCGAKTTFVTTDNKPTEKGQVINRHSMFEDFCSTSTYDMDSSLTLSQLSASSTSNPTEFVNPGLILWNQTRQQWIGDNVPNHNRKAGQTVISWNATYDNLLGTNKAFSRPIPLPEMVSFLVDIWEQEGLYD